MVLGVKMERQAAWTLRLLYIIWCRPLVVYSYQLTVSLCHSLCRSGVEISPSNARNPDTVDRRYVRQNFLPSYSRSLFSFGGRRHLDALAI